MTNNNLEFIIKECPVCKTDTRFNYIGLQKSLFGYLKLYNCEICGTTKSIIDRTYKETKTDLLKRRYKPCG